MNAQDAREAQIKGIKDYKYQARQGFPEQKQSKVYYQKSKVIKCTILQAHTNHKPGYQSLSMASLGNICSGEKSNN